MWPGPLRLLVRMWWALVRSGRLAFCVTMAGAAGAALADPNDPPGQVAWARYSEPTTRYPHGVLGDTVEHGALEIKYEFVARPITIRLPQERVFEDVAPRLIDLDGDGQSEVVVVESHRDQGARLAIYTAAGLVAATPYIGQRFRWLAPIGAGDLDGDGQIEIAYIDRPHLAKTLRVWRFRNGGLEQVAALLGVTNHRIGERDIAGGIRWCGALPEMIVANADWQRIIAVRLQNGTLTTRDVGPHHGRRSFTAAMTC